MPLYSRIALLAQVAEVFHATSGAFVALAEVERRSGTWFDPKVAEAFRQVAADETLWWELDEGAEAMGIADVDEGETLLVDEDYIDDVAEAFADVVDAKTPFTGGHSDRVADFTDMIAEQLGFDRERRRRLRRAALLHDIGKLGVSNTIVDKPGKLNDGEWKAMRHHPVASEAILSRIAIFADAARIGGSHHERLDGMGYPRGIAGAAIDLETRIVTVADVFDALTADRPYRKAMPISQAFSIIDADLGSAFDDTCVHALKPALASSRTLTARAA